MVSSDWGIMKFSLGGRGYLYDRPDWGSGNDESLRILASWEPVGDQQIFEACFLETYLREWKNLLLPPLLGQWAEGPSDLMREAIRQVLHRSSDLWRGVINEIADALNS
jgi:hypothetical protein